MLASVYGKPVQWFFGVKEEPLPSPKHPNVEASAIAGSLGGEDISLDDVRRNFEARFDRLETFVHSAIAETRAGDVTDAEPAIRPVEVVELAAAAGGGADVYDETVVGCLWFRRDWLERNAIEPTQCNVISVRGESMEPILPSGCSILVDRSQGRRRRRNGRIFVMRTEDGLVVKRLRKDEEGDWQIVSENPAWPSAPWSDDAEIIGEVRWAARTF